MTEIKKPKPKQRAKIPYAEGSTAWVIALGSPKGGPGKTTIAVALAAALSRWCEGPVILADFDLTGNGYKHLARSAALGEQRINVEHHHLWSLVGEGRVLTSKIAELARRSQFLILDTPGAIENPGAQTALTAADLVLLPICPAAYDIEATMQGLQILESVAARNPDQLHMVVVNKPEKTKVAIAAEENIVEQLASKPDVILAHTKVRKSVGHNESALTGLPLWELGSSGKNPTADIESLLGEILSALGGRSNGQ